MPVLKAKRHRAFLARPRRGGIENVEPGSRARDLSLGLRSWTSSEGGGSRGCSRLHPMSALTSMRAEPGWADREGQARSIFAGE